MRFSISLLTIICIASVIGTVLKQHEPLNNYVNQFGPFWTQAFAALDLYAVYSAWWFMLILAFLVVSTSLCIARNTPKILVDLRTYKEHLRASSLKAFHHRAEGVVPGSRDATFAHVSALLAAGGWKAKAEVREGEGGGVMVAARKGAANKLGYIAAHSAIVLVCIGGLFDGDLIVRAQMAWQDKTAFAGGGMLADVPAAHVLNVGNPTYRGNIGVNEGQRGSTAVIQMKDGVVLQPLPFDIELKKFIVEFYPTGSPRLFASDVVLHDRATGERTETTIKVNQPAQHSGVTIYQSSFEDGGSKLRLTGWPLAGGKPFELAGEVGGGTLLQSPGGEKPMTIEFTGLRTINVENLAAADAQGATDVRKVDLVNRLEQHLGSGAKSANEQALRNIGPSVGYKLRDAAGQAREYNNYMNPVVLDGQRVFLAGVREDANQPFSYLRIPADQDDSLATWMRLRAGLLDAAQREAAVQRYVTRAAPDKPEMASQLAVSARRALELFAGAEPGKPEGPMTGGLLALSDFLEVNVPEADRQRTSDVLLRIMSGTLFELLNLTRERADLPPLTPDDSTQAFMTQAVLSLSDSFFYPAPVLMALDDYTHIQASVFQVTRSPGKTLVYLGCLFLIVGVFAMLYVRERRLWIWLQDAPGGATRLTTALSSTRQTLDIDREFEQIRATLLPEAKP
ncbi:MAG: cytochrome c biogenesis protein ResB [Methylibium sp.]|nr:cytochrome c biogenesis protein ResB [Methylibium sp.]